MTFIFLNLIVFCLYFTASFYSIWCYCLFHFSKSAPLFCVIFTFFLCLSEYILSVFFKDSSSGAHLLNIISNSQKLTNKPWISVCVLCPFVCDSFVYDASSELQIALNSAQASLWTSVSLYLMACWSSLPYVLKASSAWQVSNWTHHLFLESTSSCCKSYFSWWNHHSHICMYKTRYSFIPYPYPHIPSSYLSSLKLTYTMIIK